MLMGRAIPLNIISLLQFRQAGKLTTIQHANATRVRCFFLYPSLLYHKPRIGNKSPFTIFASPRHRATSSRFVLSSYSFNHFRISRKHANASSPRLYFDTSSPLKPPSYETVRQHQIQVSWMYERLTAVTRLYTCARTSGSTTWTSRPTATASSSMVARSVESLHHHDKNLYIQALDQNRPSIASLGH